MSCRKPSPADGGGKLLRSIRGLSGPQHVAMNPAQVAKRTQKERIAQNPRTQLVTGRVDSSAEIRRARPLTVFEAAADVEVTAAKAARADRNEEQVRTIRSDEGTDFVRGAVHPCGHRLRGLESERRGDQQD